MNYLESKHIPQDLFTVIGSFLSYQQINYLSRIKNPSFSSDSQVYKDYLIHEYPLVTKHCSITNYKKTLQLIHTYDNLVDFSCAEGYLSLLDEFPDQVPSDSALRKAYNKDRKVIAYIHEKHFKEYEDSGFHNKAILDSKKCGLIAITLASTFIVLGCLIYIGYFAITLMVSQDAAIFLVTSGIILLPFFMFGILIVLGMIGFQIVSGIIRYERYTKPWLTKEEYEPI